MIEGEPLSYSRSSATRHPCFERERKAVHGRSKLSTMIEAGAAAIQMQFSEPPHVVPDALETRCSHRGVDDRRGLEPQTTSGGFQAAQVGGSEVSADATTSGIGKRS
jgi:hypothetical protein